MTKKTRSKRGSGSIRLLPSGRFQARFSHAGQAATKVCDTKQAATAWLNRQAQEVARGSWQPPERRETEVNLGPGGPKFSKFAAQWLASRDLSPRARSDYRVYLDRDLLPEFGDYRLRHVRVKDVRDWYEGYKVNAPVARARGYGLLHAIFETAWRDDLIESNPCRVQGAATVKRQTKTILPTGRQVVQLADAMPTQKYRVMALVAATCGLRFGELTELRRKDVQLTDEDDVWIRVERAVSRVKGGVVVGPPKSEAGVREVVLPDGVRDEFVAHLDQMPTSPETLLFPGSRSGRHMMPSTLYRVFYPAREQIGLPALRWHDLRHFAATTASSSGASLADVQKYLGHSTVSAAMKYQHAARGSSQQIAGRMAEVVPLRPANSA